MPTTRRVEESAGYDPEERAPVHIALL